MTKAIRWQSILGAAAALALTVTAAAAQTPAKSGKPAGSGVEHVVAGTVTKVDAAAKTVAIKTARGTTEVLKFGAEGAAKTAVATKEGVDVVAHYSVKGGEKTLTGIEEVDRSSSTLTALAGTPLQLVQQAADDAGLMCGVDLGARGSCTIGGNVATNAGGNQVLRYGMTRKNVLGLEAVLADGTVVRSLNRMMKNNAGYDLNQLFIGSEGTLGIVTRVVLRLHAQPQSKVTALIATPDYAATVKLLRRLQGSLGEISGFEAMWPDFYRYVVGHPTTGVKPLATDYPFYALIEYQGSEAERDRERFEVCLGAAIEGADKPAVAT